MTESGNEIVNPKTNSGEAALIKQFAHQFNLSMGSSSKQQKGKEDQSLQEKISSALSRMDLLLKENFELKREIVFERKKYVDLQ